MLYRKQSRASSSHLGVTGKLALVAVWGRDKAEL